MKMLLKIVTVAFCFILTTNSSFGQVQMNGYPYWHDNFMMFNSITIDNQSGNDVEFNLSIIDMLCSSYNGAFAEFPLNTTNTVTAGNSITGFFPTPTKINGYRTMLNTVGSSCGAETIIDDKCSGMVQQMVNVVPNCGYSYIDVSFIPNGIPPQWDLVITIHP